MGSGPRSAAASCDGILCGTCTHHTPYTRSLDQKSPAPSARKGLPGGIRTDVGHHPAHFGAAVLNWRGTRKRHRRKAMSHADAAFPLKTTDMTVSVALAASLGNVCASVVRGAVAGVSVVVSVVAAFVVQVAAAIAAVAGAHTCTAGAMGPRATRSSDGTVAVARFAALLASRWTGVSPAPASETEDPVVAGVGVPGHVRRVIRRRGRGARRTGGVAEGTLGDRAVAVHGRGRVRAPHPNARKAAAGRHDVRARQDAQTRTHSATQEQGRWPARATRRQAKATAATQTEGANDNVRGRGNEGVRKPKEQAKAVKPKGEKERRNAGGKKARRRARRRTPNTAKLSPSQ